MVRNSKSDNRRVRGQEGRVGGWPPADRSQVTCAQPGSLRPGTRTTSWGELDAPVAKSTLSHHLRVLRSSGVTRTREEGTRCYVHLRAEELEERFPGLLQSLMASPGHGATTVAIKPPRQFA